MLAAHPFLGLLQRAFAAEGREVPLRLLQGEQGSLLDGPTLTDPRLPGFASSTRSEERTPDCRRPRRPRALFVDPLSETGSPPSVEAMPAGVGQLVSDQLEPTRSYTSLHRSPASPVRSKGARAR